MDVSVCEEYGIKDVYVVGGYPRDMVMGSMSQVSDIDFSGAWPNQCLKMGSLLASKLGINFRSIIASPRINELQ